MNLKTSEKRKLQVMIDRTSSASAEFFKEQAKLNDWCAEKYGYEPGDVDSDNIIDSVLGGCGAASGMRAAAFHEEMVSLKYRFFGQRDANQ